MPGKAAVPVHDPHLQRALEALWRHTNGLLVYTPTGPGARDVIFEDFWASIVQYALGYDSMLHIQPEPPGGWERHRQRQRRFAVMNSVHRATIIQAVRDGQLTAQQLRTYINTGVLPVA